MRSVRLTCLWGIEARYSDTNADAHVSRSIFRFDREALISEHIADGLGHSNLTFHLRRLQDDGPFDQYAAHIEHLWDGGTALHPTTTHEPTDLTS